MGIRLDLSTQRVQVDPGGQAYISASVANIGAEAEDVLVSIGDVDPAWVTFQPRVLTVNPGATEIVYIMIAPPPGVTGAGDYGPVVRLFSRLDNSVQAEGRFSLRLAAPLIPPPVTGSTATRQMAVQSRPRSGPPAWVFGLGGLIALLIGVAVLLFLFLPRTQSPSVAKTCTTAATKVPSLYSDDTTTAILLSNTDQTDVEVLRTEPADVLPGLFSSLLSLSDDSSKLAYVTADNEAMDNAHIMAIDVANPAQADELATLPSGFWNVKPVWSPDNHHLAFLRLDPDAAAQGQTKLDLWVAETGNQQLHRIVVPSLKPEDFYSNPNIPFCWAADNQTLIFSNVPPDAAAQPQTQTQVDIESGQSATINRPVQPTPVVEPGRLPPTPQPTAQPGASSGGAGGVIPPGKGSDCGVPVYSQNDPHWSRVLMQSGGDAIGPEGCALTSTTMILNYYGATITPAQLNSCMGAGADPVSWSAAVRCPQGVNVTYEGRPEFAPNDEPSALSDLAAFLAKGSPAIVGMRRGQTGMHFVVVTAGAGNNPANYAVTDPWDGSTGKTLQYFKNSGYWLTWIVKYTGTGKVCTRTPPNGGADSPTVGGVVDGGVYKDPVTVGGYTGDGGSVGNGTITNVSPGNDPTIPAPTIAPTGGTPAPAPTTPPAVTTKSGGSIITITPPTKRPPGCLGTFKIFSDCIRIINHRWIFHALVPGTTLTDEGVYRISLYAKAGAAWRMRTITFTIDRSPPTLDLVLLNSSGAPGGTPTPAAKAGMLRLVDGVQIQGAAKIQVAARDTLSGVKTITYALDGGPEQDYSNDTTFKKTLTVDVPGDHTLLVRASDGAGNVATQTFTFTVVNGTPIAPPTTSPSVTGATPTDTGIAQLPTLTTMPTVTVSPTITITPGPPALKVNPTSLTFGDGVSAQTLTLQNTGGSSLNWKADAGGNALVGLSANQGMIDPGQTFSLGVTVNRSPDFNAPATLPLNITSDGGNAAVSLTIQPNAIGASFVSPTANSPIAGREAGGKQTVTLQPKGAVDHVTLTATYGGQSQTLPQANAGNNWTVAWDTSAIPPQGGISLIAKACTANDARCTDAAAVSGLTIVAPTATFASPQNDQSYTDTLPIRATVGGGYADHIDFTLTNAAGAVIIDQYVTAQEGWATGTDVSYATTHLSGPATLVGKVCWSADNAVCFPMTPITNISINPVSAVFTSPAAGSVQPNSDGYLSVSAKVSGPADHITLSLLDATGNTATLRVLPHLTAQTQWTAQILASYGRTRLRGIYTLRGQVCLTQADDNGCTQMGDVAGLNFNQPTALLTSPKSNTNYTNTLLIAATVTGSADHVSVTRIAPDGTRSTPLRLTSDGNYTYTYNLTQLGGQYTGYYGFQSVVCVSADDSVCTAMPDVVNVGINIPSAVFTCPKANSTWNSDQVCGAGLRLGAQTTGYALYVTAQIINNATGKVMQEQMDGGQNTFILVYSLPNGTYTIKGQVCWAQGSANCVAMPSLQNVRVKSNGSVTPGASAFLPDLAPAWWRKD